MKNLLFNSRFVYEVGGGEKVKNVVDEPKPGTEVSTKTSKDTADKKFTETAEEGKIAVNKAREEAGKVTRLKEKLIVGNIVDENGNVNSTNYIIKLAEQRGIEIEERLIPFSEQIDKYLSADGGPLDEFLGEGATSKLIDQLATAYTKMIDSGNYEGVKELCYDVNAYLTDFHGGYNSSYRKDHNEERMKEYNKSVQAAANDLKGVINKAVS